MQPLQTGGRIGEKKKKKGHSRAEFSLSWPLTGFNFLVSFRPPSHLACLTEPIIQLICPKRIQLLFLRVNSQDVLPQFLSDSLKFDLKMPPYVRNRNLLI
jgi:hypothetical protein